MKLSKLFGKQVFSLYEGEVVATICDVNFNKQNSKIKGFKVFDQDENEYALASINIKAMNDFVIIANKNKCEVYSSLSPQNPLNKLVLNECAENMGQITDAEIDKDGNVLHFITSLNINLNPKHMYVRKDFIYYSEKKINICGYKPKKQKINLLSEIKVNVLNINNKENFVPKRVQYNPETIIGKVAKNDLIGINNEIIIKANQVITEKIIKDATKHNRLNQLYFIAV